MSAYRSAAEVAVDPVSWPRWKFLLACASWGAVGVVLTTVAFAMALFSKPSPCEDKLQRIDGDHTTIECEHGAHFAGYRVIYPTDNTRDYSYALCQCPGNKKLYQYVDQTDASVATAPPEPAASGGADHPTAYPAALP